MAKRIMAAVFMGIFLVLGAEAAMVSVMVIETGLPQGERSQYSERWESSLMDVFFDEGYIVSNVPILRFDTKQLNEIQRVTSADMKEAGEGGADYFIVVRLDYASSLQPPDEISFSLFSISPYKKIYEKQIKGKTYRSVRDEIADLKVIVGELVPYLNRETPP